MPLSPEEREQLRRERWANDPYNTEFDEKPQNDDPYAPGGPPMAGPVPPPPSSGGTELPPDDYGSFEIPQFPGGGRPSFDFGPVPEFNPTMFSAPSFEDAQNEPGYQFRLGSGQKALESSAAARGLLRTGGTLKDLVTYGQNFGAQEYSNVFNRALQSYGTQYQAERDAFAPRLQEWTTRSGAEQAAGLSAFDRDFQAYQAYLNALMQQQQIIGGLGV